MGSDPLFTIHVNCDEKTANTYVKRKKRVRPHLWRVEKALPKAANPLREPVMDCCEIRRDESLQRWRFGVAPNLRLELAVIRLRQDSRGVISVPRSFECRIPGGLVLFSHDVVVQLSP